MAKKAGEGQDADILLSYKFGVFTGVNEIRVTLSDFFLLGFWTRLAKISRQNIITWLKTYKSETYKFKK